MRYRMNVSLPSAEMNLNAFTPKYFSLPKLAGVGLGAWMKASAFGWEARYSPIEPSLTAVKNSRASWPFEPGKPSTEWVMMSVCTRRGVSASTKRIAKPRGLPLGSVSGSSGIPVELENRAIMGVEGLLK